MRRCLALAAFCGLTTSTLAAPPAPPKKEKPLLVVDGSRDGGVWWYPQLPKTEDATKPHQGKPLADALKKQGWDVQEIPRNAAVSLTGAKVVLRMGSIGNEYTKDEIAAYKDFVKEGGTLLMTGNVADKGKTTADPLAAEYGYEFGEGVRAPAATWSTDPFVKGLGAAPFVFGAKLAKTPSGASQLATVGTDTVISMATVEKGRVFAFGSATPLIQLHAVNSKLFETPKK